MTTAEGSATRLAGTATRNPTEATRVDLPIISNEALAEARTASTGESAMASVRAAACAPLEAVYRLIGHRALEDASGSGTAAGPPQLVALQALREGAVVGDPERLGLLFADPAALPLPSVPDRENGAETETGAETQAEAESGGEPEPGPDPDLDPDADAIESAVRAPAACLVEVPSGATGPTARAAVRRIIERLARDRRRVLLFAPDEPALDDVLQTLGPEPGPLTVRILPGGDSGSGSGSEPEPEPNTETETEQGAAPEPGGDPSAVAKVVGTKRQAGWADRLQGLRRGLLWFEVWPQDRAALTAATAEHERLAGMFTEETARLAGEVDRWRATIPAAGQAVTEARAEHERLADHHGRLAEECAALNAERDRLARLAEAAEQAAVGCARTAQEVQDRCSALDRRIADHRAELERARQTEASLTEDLARAHQALPEAAAEVERLADGAAAADAEWHASYYRLAAAESTLAAHRRKLSWGQRMSVVSARHELKEHRNRVATRTREAERAAGRARQAKEAYDTAAEQHAALVEFTSTGERDLAAAKAAQERLVPEIAKLETELAAARADHETLAVQAAEAAERATAASATADRAGQVAGRAEGLLSEAQISLRAAERAAAEAQAALDAAARGLAGGETALRDKRAEAESTLAASRAEVETATRTEAVSRRHVEELCGADPATAPDEVLAGHRDRVMADVVWLDALLETAGHGGAALREADLICATPAVFAMHPAAAVVEADTLVVYDAGRVTDGDLLIGAVRARHWILVGDGSPPPPTGGRGWYEDHVRALTALRLAERYDPESAGGDGAAEPSSVPPTRALPIVHLPEEGAGEEDSSALDRGAADDSPGEHPAEQNTGASVGGCEATTPLPTVDLGATDPLDGSPDGAESGADAGATGERRSGPAGEPASEPAGEPAGEPVGALGEPTAANGTGPADPLEHALADLKAIMAGTGVDVPSDAVAEAGGSAATLAAVRAEAERIRSAGLWSGRYRTVYLDVLDRLRTALGGDRAELELQALLDSTIADRIRHGSFTRIATAAPRLCHRLGERPAAGPRPVSSDDHDADLDDDTR